MEAQKYDQLSEQAQVVLEQDSLGAEARAAGHNVKEKGGDEGTLQGQKRWDFRICCMHTREGGGVDFQVNIK